jgi:hypothetical protein
MAIPGNPLPQAFEWMAEMGVRPDELRDLYPCVPGEFTDADSYYVNSATPGVVYRGTAEGTLPLVAGRWYLIPSDTVDRHPELRQNAARPARAVRLAR